MSLPAQVSRLTGAYLAAMAEELPGRLEGLYLYGSVALGDYHPGDSDIDFVAVLPEPREPRTLASLAKVHHRLGVEHPVPHFDGIYLDRSELAVPPYGTTGPFVTEHRFHPDGGFERVPVTWHSLAQTGVRVHGPRLSDVTIGVDTDLLADWTHHNLDQYWRPWWHDASNPLSAKGISCLGAACTVWAVLGVSRLHYTLDTGRITSKTGAGEYARTIFSARWHPIIDEALRIRRGTGERARYLNPIARRTDLLAYLDMVIEDAHRADPQYRDGNTTMG